MTRMPVSKVSATLGTKVGYRHVGSTRMFEAESGAEGKRARPIHKQILILDNQ